MMEDEEDQEVDEERGRVALNVGQVAHTPGHVGPQEERREEKGMSAELGRLQGRRGSEAQEKERRAQEAREEETRVREAREQKRVQEAQEREAKAQEEREREAKAQEERKGGVSAHEERREQEREVLGPGGAEGEDANSLHEESHVSNRT